MKDNQTVVIGGLMQEKDEENVTKVPFLGDIPVLGWLFTQKSISKNKTNLIVFLTPHIIKGAEQIERLTEAKKIEFARVEDTYKQGELLVKFTDDTTEARAAEIISAEGASVIAPLKPKGSLSHTTQDRTGRERGGTRYSAVIRKWSMQSRITS